MPPPTFRPPSTTPACPTASSRGSPAGKVASLNQAGWTAPLRTWQTWFAYHRFPSAPWTPPPPHCKRGLTAPPSTWIRWTRATKASPRRWRTYLGMTNVPQTRRMACAIIANALVFHERIAGMHPTVKPLGLGVRPHGCQPQGGNAGRVGRHLEDQLLAHIWHC